MQYNQSCQSSPANLDLAIGSTSSNNRHKIHCHVIHHSSMYHHPICRHLIHRHTIYLVTNPTPLNPPPSNSITFDPLQRHYNAGNCYTINAIAMKSTASAILHHSNYSNINLPSRQSTTIKLPLTLPQRTLPYENNVISTTICSFFILLIICLS